MDDDDFGDDDLDAIPDNTLQELESKAFSWTQRAKINAIPEPQQPRIQTYGAPGLNRKYNVAKSAWRPPQPRQQQHSQPKTQTAPPASAPEPPSSDYGFDEEDVIDLDEPSMVIQSTSALPTRSRVEPSARPATYPARYGSRALVDPETEAAFAAADAELGAPRPAQWDSAPHLQPKANDGIDVSSLQARIAELEANQAQLRQSEQEARNAALAKQGEIAIVRANQEKATKEYERRLAVMQKMHADNAAKQKAELEAGKKEREKMKTDNRFLQHDLAQEAERAKRLTGPGKARAAAASAAVTPRKSKRGAALGDGFEDEEVVMLVSPSKSKEKEKSGGQTPKAGVKRKRVAQDSPVPVLSFTQPLVKEESGEQLLASFESQIGGGAAVVSKEDGRYDFMQRMLNHCPYEGHGRSVETLTKHAFLSTPDKSLSSILLDQLSSPNATDQEPHLPLKLSFVLLKIWNRCLEEQYYPPFYLLLDLLRFALYFELSATTSQLVEEAVPLCIKSIDLIAVPLARASKIPSFTATAEYKASEQAAEYIDVDEILDFLHRLCSAASLSLERIDVFWRNMEFTFTLLMLNKALPISQITTALRILSTSILPTTFGSICRRDLEGSGAQVQAMQERDTIDRLTCLLFEIPEVPSSEPTYTDEEIAELRIEILNVLKALCLTDHGCLQLAQHRSAIGRLIRFLDGQVNQLYTTRPTLGLELHTSPSSLSSHPSPPSPPPTHTLITQTVNTTVRLLYHLLRTHEDSINFSHKVSVIKGGYHRFIISVTRIAFAEPHVVFEAGIEDEVVEAAHAILDGILSPEEGEAVMRAVETPRGSGMRGIRTGVGMGEGMEGGSAGEEGDIGMSEPG